MGSTWRFGTPGHAPASRSLCALGAELRPLKAYNSVGLYDAASVVAIARGDACGGLRGPQHKSGIPTLAEDLAAVRAAGECWGTGIALMVDYNQALGVDEAIARCRALDGEGLEWIEEPVLADDLEACARRRCARGDADPDRRELQRTFGDARPSLAKALDLVMPDAQYIHGVTGWLEAAALACTAGLRMSSHTFVEASAHLLCATPTAHWLEVLDAAGGLRQRSADVTRRDGDALECTGYRFGVGRRGGDTSPNLTGPPWRQEHDLLPTDHRTADRKVWVIGAAKGVAQSRNGRNSERVQKCR